MKKKALERQGKLSVRVKVEKEFVDVAIALLNSQ
jgi:hypothetical protein